MRLFRFFLIILLLALAGSYIAYKGLHKGRFDVVAYLDPYPDHVTVPHVSLSGKTSTPARIELSRGIVLLGQVISAPDNSFHFASVPLDPGVNDLRLTVKPPASDDYRSWQDFAIIWEPAKPTAPALNALPSITNMPSLLVSGTSYPTAGVKVTVVETPSKAPKTKLRSPSRTRRHTKPAPVLEQNQPSEKAEVITAETKAGQDGHFQTTLELNHRGTYKVRAVASNSSGVISPASSEMELAYDPEWYPSTNDPHAASGGAIVRKADLVFAHKRLQTTLTAILPRNHPAVAALLSNKSTVDDFFDEIFSLEFNGIHYGSTFENVVPNITLDDKMATIWASANSEGQDFMPLLHGAVKISSNAGFPFHSPKDTLTISISDYSVRALNPSPTTLSHNVYTWSGVENHDQPAYENPNPDGVTLQLDYNPLASPRNLFHMSQLSPYLFWRYPWDAILTLLFALFGVVPIVWTFWLLQTPLAKSLIDKQLQTSILDLCLVLITISLVQALLSLSSALAYEINDFKFAWLRTTERPVIRFGGALVILTLALLMQLISRPFIKKTWGIWVKAIAIGLRNAAIIVAFTVITDVGDYPVLSRVAAFAVACVTGGLVWFYLRRVIHRARVPRRYLIILNAITICILLALAVPVLNPYSRYRSDFSFLIFVSILQDLAPYFMAIALVVLLQRMNRVADLRHNAFVLTVGLILFAGYLVGSAAHLLLIPIPFFLAVWGYGKYLMRDVKERKELATVSKEVVTRRSGLIHAVMVSDAAEHFQMNLDKLGDKVGSGDLTPEDFEKRIAEIQTYAAEKEQATKLSNGLSARDGVLSVGPNIYNWQNGVWSAGRGGLLILPFLCAYVVLLIVRSSSFSQEPNAIIFLAVQIITFVFDWLIAAFFFGYFFRDIRGDYGLSKGWRTAGLVIMCLLPSWMSRISNNIDLIGVLFRVVQTFLFFTVLGIWAFDYHTFRTAMGKRFRWRTFTRFGKVPTLTAAASLVLPGVSLILTTLFTGRVPDLIAKLIGAAFPHVPAGPP